ncbi:OsmC family protein [Turneriella parva]|uniref:OsmC family protein n=1 Tax=Turneriella parva (strain ATCC BAA-1111 / DSM 21527 / NCTC 11395 / H) TaxID=869212 RepID=I4B7J1_TURPD|nr:OsmC family protein [Turneriella parva]AFM13248.1 OsmC family protein [Turneriella parva DSM 21527]
MSATKITLTRIGEPFHFEAKNAAGNTVQIDAGPAIGGTGKGARPMELLLMGLAGCSGIDVVTILQKQRQTVEAMSVEVVGERGESQEANPFTNIVVRFSLAGQIEDHFLKRAIELSMDKYCSVAKTLEKTATISYEYALNAQ